MSPDRSKHLLHSLLANPAFRSWAEGKCPEDDAAWQQWADANGAGVLQKAIDLARAVPVRDAHLTDDYIHRKVSAALQAAKKQEAQQASGRSAPFFPVFASGWNIAASVLIVAGLCFALLRIYNPARRPMAARPSAPDWKEIANLERPFKYVQLPDGSSVVLHQNSRLKYKTTFSDTIREVHLTGEAFFEVTKDAARPFYVYADDLVAKVHGTSFSVRADAAKVSVAVKTGKVSVFSKQDPAMLLTCNQQATFERAQARLVRSSLKSSVLLNIPIENQGFTYQETPAAEVFETLGKLYGVSITFDRNSLARCSVTATLGDEPLENKLKWLCTILEASYTMTDDGITITGNPCN